MYPRLCNKERNRAEKLKEKSQSSLPSSVSEITVWNSELAPPMLCNKQTNLESKKRRAKAPDHHQLHKLGLKALN